MASINYVGRKVDLSIFPTLIAEKVPVTSGISQYPKVISGINMSVQNFARIILTPLGHYRSDPLMGSLLLSKLSLQSVRYAADIMHAFAIEASRVMDYMKANTRADAPLDELIKSATLVSHKVDGSTIDLEIEIESQASEKVSFLLPVNWTT